MSKKLIPLMFVSTALLLAGCTIGKKTSSASGSGEQSSGSQAAQTASLKITKANSGIDTTDGLAAAKQVTYTTDAGNVVLEWSAGCYNYSKYDEIGVAKTSGYVKLVSLPEGFKVSTLVLDFYKYENAKVFASADGSGSELAASQTGASDLADSILKTYNLDGTAFYVGNTSSYAQAFYSITLNLSK